MDNRKKGILSLVAAVLLHLLMGNIFSFPNFIPYYKSYLYHKNNEEEKVSKTQLYFITPIGIFALNTLPIVTGFLDKILGTKVMTIIATITLIFSQLIFYFFINYYLVIISYFLFGVAGSLAYFQTLKNCWKYFPGKEGLISGIIFSAFGLSSFTFTSLGDLIINKDHVDPESDGFYRKDIALKFLDYIKLYLICVVIMGTISSILCFTYNEENIGENRENDLTKIIEGEENVHNEGDTEDKVDLVKKEEKEEKELNIFDTKLTLKESILSVEFSQCLAVAGCTLIFGFLLTNTYRNFGIERKLNELGMQTLSKAYTMLNTFSRIAWGFIFDKFGFKKPYIIVCINQLICGLAIYHSSKNLITYFIVVCFGVLSFSGHIILFPNLIKIKFGVENSVIILGICGMFSGIASLMGPILTLFILKKEEDYLMIYLIGVSPIIISLILTFFIKVKYMKDIKDVKDIIADTPDDKHLTDKTVSFENTEE
jgi:MFS family permease